MTSKRDYGKIVNSGMGWFLNPPTHPEHEFSVQSSYGDTFSMALSSAAESEWLNSATRAKAKAILKNWKRPDLDTPAVQEWIAQVLGYFKGCYKGLDGPNEWNASNLKIDSTIDPVLNANLHAGVHCIRKYYPEFVPTAEHFKGAYWGQKPEAA